jgi:uncharacterized membrane protein (DUF441 family)
VAVLRRGVHLCAFWGNLFCGLLSCSIDGVSTIRGAGVRCLIRSGIRGEVFGEQHEGWGVYWET